MVFNIPQRAVGACAVLLAVVTTAAACSSSGSGSGGSALPTSPAARQSGVTHAYETFFDYRTPPATGETLLQDGAAFRSALQTAAAAASKQRITVKVTSVSAGATPKVAKVIYTLSLGGTPTLKGASGAAVLENGKWKVAGITFCGLLNLNGANPPVCKDPKATTLPS